MPLTPSQLTAHLATMQHPVVMWSNSAGERLELTGRVFANWVYKSAGLLAELEAGPQTPLVIFCTPGEAFHWRPLAALVAAQALAAPVIIAAQAVEVDDSWIAMGDAANHETVAELSDQADEVLLYDAAPLALKTEVDSGFIDFISVVRTYPDQAALPAGSGFNVTIAGSTAQAPAVDTSQTGFMLTGMPAQAQDMLTALAALPGGGLTLAAAE